MITDEQRTIADYIKETWQGKFRIELGLKLSTLFSEPQNKGLRHIWRYGEADIAIFRNDKLVAIIEPGGAQHFDEKQAANDRRKWKLADVNGVRCLSLMNNLHHYLSKRKWRALIGKVLFHTELVREKQFLE